MVGEGRRAVPDRHYVQVRYPDGGRWVSVAVAEQRDAAATMAANAYRSLHDETGHAPSQVRVIISDDLSRQGGDAALALAEADLRDFSDQE